MRARLLLLTLPLLAAACDDGEEAPQGRSDAARRAAAPQAAATPSAGAQTAAAADSAQPASSGPAILPKMRPGMWRSVTTSSMMEPHASEDCITADAAQKMAQDPAAWVVGMGECRDFRVSREGEAMVMRASCSGDAVTAQLEIRASGDFQTRSRQIVIIRAKGRPDETRLTTESTWIRAC